MMVGKKNAAYNSRKKAVSLSVSIIRFATAHIASGRIIIGNATTSLNEKENGSPM